MLRFIPSFLRRPAVRHLLTPEQREKRRQHIVRRTTHLFDGDPAQFDERRIRLSVHLLAHLIECSILAAIERGENHSSLLICEDFNKWFDPVTRRIAAEAVKEVRAGENTTDYEIQISGELGTHRMFVRAMWGPTFDGSTSAKRSHRAGMFPPYES